MALELEGNEMYSFNCTDNTSKLSTSLKKQFKIITNLQQVKQVFYNNFVMLVVKANKTLYF